MREEPQTRWAYSFGSDRVIAGLLTRSGRGTVAHGPGSLDHIADRLYIFRNIDELTTDGVERLGNFILAALDSDLPVTVAATLSDASPNSGFPF